MGLWAENKIQNNFQEQGYRLLEQRKKTPFGEIDLWLYSKDLGFLAVEVKSLQSLGFLERRVSRKQKLRLIRTWTWILEKYPETPFLVAYVPPKGLPLILSLTDI